MIVINDFKMPKNCKECPFLLDDDACYAVNKPNSKFLPLVCNGSTDEYPVNKFPYWEKRVDWCPLEEVPDEEPKKAQWEYYPALYAYGVPHYKCSLCGHQVQYRTPFCPGCGSEMRGEG